MNKTHGHISLIWTKFLLSFHFESVYCELNSKEVKYCTTLIYFKILPYIKQFIKRSLLFGTSYHKIWDISTDQSKQPRPQCIKDNTILMKDGYGWWCDPLAGIWICQLSKITKESIVIFDYIILKDFRIYFYELWVIFVKFQ